MAKTMAKTTENRQTFKVNPIDCTGHGVCAELLPELISLDEWGYPVILGDVPAGLERHARRAVRACPVLALRLQQADGDHDGRA